VKASNFHPVADAVFETENPIKIPSLMGKIPMKISALDLLFSLCHSLGRAKAVFTIFLCKKNATVNLMVIR
jgi:hypothetical protein